MDRPFLLRLSKCVGVTGLPDVAIRWAIKTTFSHTLVYI